MTPVMPTRASLTIGALAAALGLSLLTPAPAGLAATPIPRAVPADHALVATSASLDTRFAVDAVNDAALADPAPLAKTGPVNDGVLRLGATGNKVTWVQRVLGVDRTGYYGPLTRLAVVRFQKVVGLRPTGEVDRTTHDRLAAYDARQKARAARLAARRAAAAAAAAKAAADAPDPAPAPSSSGSGDPTLSSAARTSRTARVAVSFSEWQSSAHGHYISYRESHNVCSAVSRSGAYRGKWQMSSSLWKAYGGTAYATTADKATCGEQDRVAYRVWLASWWYPWGG